MSSYAYLAHLTWQGYLALAILTTIYLGCVYRLYRLMTRRRSK